MNHKPTRGRVLIVCKKGKSIMRGTMACPLRAAGVAKAYKLAGYRVVVLSHPSAMWEDT